MTGRGAEVRNANGVVIMTGKKAEVGKGSAAEAKNADVAVLEAEIADLEAAIGAHSKLFDVQIECGF